jgi:hypothetical protein
MCGARPAVRTFHPRLEVLDRHPGCQDTSGYRLQQIGKLRNHVADRLADVGGDRVTVDLRHPLIDADDVQIRADDGQTDRRRGVDGFKL